MMSDGGQTHMGVGDDDLPLFYPLDGGSDKGSVIKKMFGKEELELQL